MQTELLFPASRAKAALMLICSCGFVALGILVLRSKPILGWLTIGFFGLGIPLSLLVMLTNRMYLKLSPAGFEMGSPLKTTFIRWSDVESFRIGCVRNVKMIAIQHKPSYAEQKTLRKVASAVGGMESAIANNYAVPLESLLEHLNTWHARFGRSEA